jgi:hypothetical protein
MDLKPLRSLAEKCSQTTPWRTWSCSSGARNNAKTRAEQCKNTSGPVTIRQATTADAAYGSVASCSLSLAVSGASRSVAPEGRNALAVPTRSGAAHAAVGGSVCCACVCVCARVYTRAHTQTHVHEDVWRQRQSIRAAAHGDPPALMEQDRPADFGGRDSLPLITAP